MEVDVRGKRLKAAITECHMRGDAPPYARPIIYGTEFEGRKDQGEGRAEKALNLLKKSVENHRWRQDDCINLIPSENTPSHAVQMLCASDPAYRYAEHKKIKSFYDQEVFYYQGTKFIDEVEQMAIEELKKYFNCTEVETRVISGQMSNMAVFSALMDWKQTGQKGNPQASGICSEQPYY